MGEGAEGLIRRTVCYTGHVQGVGFRYTTRSVAVRFAVTGQVKNLRDGRVEMVVEGAPDEIARFSRAVGQAMASNIDDAQAADAAATGEFAGFAIVP